MAKPGKYYYGTGVIAILLLLIIALCGLYLSSRHTNQAQDEDTSQAATTAQAEDAKADKTYPVSVYFLKHPQSDDNPAATFAVKRVSKDSGVGAFAIAELLDGPTAAEMTKGYFNTARLRNGTSTCGGKPFKLAVQNKVATLQFCLPFDHLGVVADGQAESALKATLKQFSTVEKVIILDYQGNCEFDASGQNLCKE